MSLVGYTNAGKSTLFNRLTRSAVYQADKLFATLDPTLRRLPLSGGDAVILADTVGFINHLPHELVAAFRSTLEETRTADLLLHVVDAASPRRSASIRDVEGVLSEIGAGEIPQMQVFNKIDLVPGACPQVDRDAQGRVQRVWLSAATGEGVDLLVTAVAEYFQTDRVHQWVSLGPLDGGLRAWFFANARVVADRPTRDGGWDMEVMVPRRKLERLLSLDGSVQMRLHAREPGKVAAGAGG